MVSIQVVDNAAVADNAKVLLAAINLLVEMKWMIILN